MTNAGPVPWVSTAEMREVDRVMVDELGIGLELMMEHAGRQLAVVARDWVLGGTTVGRRVIVLAGKGGNGGGALVAARRMSGWGCDVHAILNSSVSELSPVTRAQLSRSRAAGVQATVGVDREGWGRADVILDGLVGYSLAGAPNARTAVLIHAANQDPALTVSLDVPSGLDASTGHMAEPTVRAAITVALALPKIGLRAPDVAATVGDIYLADIGVPGEALIRAGIAATHPIFADRDLFLIR